MHESMKRKTHAGILAASLLAMQSSAWAERPQSLTLEQADDLKDLILPQQGENPFWQVAWLNDVWEARQTAAAEGKPIFVWSGSEGAPITNC